MFPAKTLDFFLYAISLSKIGNPKEPRLLKRLRDDVYFAMWAPIFPLIISPVLNVPTSIYAPHHD